jgi:RNA polymerase sigma-70 factor (ECF subfamily)
MSPADASASLATGTGMPVADAVLAVQAAAGDRGAFEQIYRRHAARIHGLSLRLTGDRGQAEILTQDTFVKAWLALGGWSGQAPLGAWLGRIAVNCWRDQWRSEQRARRWLVDAGEDDGLERLAAQSRGAATDGVVPMLTAVDLERLIARLPEGARTVFVLHEVEGYPQAEVATLLGVSEGTIKSQMFRARALLRAMYSEPERRRHEA